MLYRSINDQARWSYELGIERPSSTGHSRRATATRRRRPGHANRSRRTDGEATDPYTQLCPEVVSIVDHRVDIARDEGSREAAAIEWYTPDVAKLWHL